MDRFLMDMKRNMRVRRRGAMRSDRTVPVVLTEQGVVALGGRHLHEAGKRRRTGELSRALPPYLQLPTQSKGVPDMFRLPPLPALIREMGLIRPRDNVLWNTAKVNAGASVPASSAVLSDWGSSRSAPRAVPGASRVPHVLP